MWMRDVDGKFVNLAQCLTVETDEKDGLYIIEAHTVERRFELHMTRDKAQHEHALEHIEKKLGVVVLAR